MLRKDKYTQIMNPRPWNWLLSMSSACEECADVPACVHGRANVLACEPCRQAIEGRPPGRQTSFMRCPKWHCRLTPTKSAHPSAVYGIIMVAAALRFVAQPAVQEP